MKSEPSTPIKVVEKPKEETWEDKEDTIENEDVRGADAEDDAAGPKRAAPPAGKFVKSASLDGKLRWRNSLSLS